jgi:GNAT superfamily N-acetyltransferase
VLAALPTIHEANTPEDYAAFGALIREYVEWCRSRYAHEPWLVDQVFSYQSLDEELRLLPAAYGPPNGRSLLAIADGEVRGAVAYRKLSEHVCEMKRMFVPSRFHGQGLGAQLCKALIVRAEADGFHTMRLDTAAAFTEAINLYRSFGFTECPPYIDYPERMKPMIVFMEKALAAR